MAGFDAQRKAVDGKGLTEKAVVEKKIEKQREQKKNAGAHPALALPAIACATQPPRTVAWLRPRPRHPALACSRGTPQSWLRPPSPATPHPASPRHSRPPRPSRAVRRLGPGCTAAAAATPPDLPSRVSCTGAKAGPEKAKKEPKDARAAEQRVRDADRNERRVAKPVSEIVLEWWVSDQAAIEAQCPGANENTTLWKSKDGHALKGKLQYTSDALRNLLREKGAPSRTRPLPVLRNAVAKAYGIA